MSTPRQLITGVTRSAPNQVQAPIHRFGALSESVSDAPSTNRKQLFLNDLRGLHCSRCTEKFVDFVSKLSLRY